MPENIDDYRRLFENSKIKQAVGEACVAYLYYYRNSIQNMFKYLDKIPKIIIVLRNPVDRAFSNYKHHVRDGLEGLSFEDAIKPEVLEYRKREKWWWGFEYIDVGYYSSQVEAYIRSFGPDNVRVYLYEDLAKKPRDILDDIFNFLELEPISVTDSKVKYNASDIPLNNSLQVFLNDQNHFIKKLIRPLFLNTIGKHNTEELVNFFKKRNLLKIKRDTRKKLTETYREDILKLEKLINRDLSGWLR